MYMPDLEQAGCILFWGYNPNLARIAHAVATTEALDRGARLIVVDPRRAGPANKADVWLRVRPGTDGALALGIAHVMIERGWYDRDFIRDWTNGPLLVRPDNGRLLMGSDLAGAADGRMYVAWNETGGRPVLYDPVTGGYEESGVEPGARMNDSLEPNVVCGQHGWWQACTDIGAPGYDPFGPDGANLNLIIGNEAIDPVSGSVPHRAYVCQIRRAD